MWDWKDQWVTNVGTCKSGYTVYAEADVTSNVAAGDTNCMTVVEATPLWTDGSELVTERYTGDNADRTTNGAAWEAKFAPFSSYVAARNTLYNDETNGLLGKL